MKAKWFSKYLLLLTIFGVLFLGVKVNFSFAEENNNELIVAKLPALVTSCGQSPDAFIVKMLFDRIKVPVSYDPLIIAEDLEGFETLLVAIGGSAKGLGEAGIIEDDELVRMRILLDKANEKKMMIFGIHIGGEGRRGPLSAKFIELTTPRVQCLIVHEEGNKDGYFTKISEEKKIPLFIIETTIELGEILKKIFQDNTQ